MNRRLAKRVWLWTPPDLAKKMAEMADVKGHLVLEPSAGRGAIVMACWEAGASAVWCIEKDKQSYEYLWKHCSRGPGGGDFYLEHGDFLMWKPPVNRSAILRILMCPPFRGGQDVEHVTHALKCLAPGGILVSLMSKATGEPFLTIDPNDCIAATRWESLPADTFRGRPAILVKITKAA